MKKSPQPASPASGRETGSPPALRGELEGGWHKRYQQQANWTRELREYIFGKIGLDQLSRVLEVGCGTGAILSTTGFPVCGLDIQLASLKEAQNHAPTSPLTCADAFSLPYADASFDIVFCHFLLLWLDAPKSAVEEMLRVTRAGGHIIAFAEPDYTRRVDEPAALAELGVWQRDALRAQGANPAMGAELAELFYGLGIKIIETGAISNTEGEPFNAKEWALEWATLEADLAGKIPDERIQKMKVLDRLAWENGERILHVPTHYIWARTQRG